MYFNKSSTFFNLNLILHSSSFNFLQIQNRKKQSDFILAKIIVRKNTHNIQCRSQVWGGSHNLFNSIESIDYKKVIFFHSQMYTDFCVSGLLACHLIAFDGRKRIAAGMKISMTKMLPNNSKALFVVQFLWFVCSHRKQKKRTWAHSLTAK